MPPSITAWCPMNKSTWIDNSEDGDADQIPDNLAFNNDIKELNETYNDPHSNDSTDARHW